LSAQSPLDPEYQHSRMRFGRGLGAQIFGVNARAADAGKAQVEALGEWGVDFVRRQLNLWIDAVEIGESPVPVVVEIGGTRIAALVAEQLLQRHVDQWHVGSPLVS
jgi:hypothetical protein